MSIEIVVEPVSSWKQLPPIPLPQPLRCPPGCVPAAPRPPQQPRCPPGCVPACPPGYRRVERLYRCQPVNNHHRQRLSPRLTQIIDNQLKKIAEGQQRQAIIQQQPVVQQIERAHSEIALSSNVFHPQSPQPIIADAARASGYALSHATSISASVEQLPAAIKEVLSVADNVVPEAGKVTYITSSSCQPTCQRPQTPPPPPRPCTPPPPPPPVRCLPPQPRPQPVICRPSSPYEVLPIIHVNRCDPCDPCNRNRRLDADCAPPQKSRLTGPTESTNSNYMTIEIEVASGNQCK